MQTVKSRIEIPVEEPVKGKRGRRHRDDEQKAEDKPQRKWKEPEGFFQGARIRKR